MWALTDFTRENGATRIIPGSPDWPDGRRADKNEIAQAEMTRGSVLLYTGSVLHAAGANDSDDDRIGLNITYSLAWLRQEETSTCPVRPRLQKPYQQNCRICSAIRWGVMPWAITRRRCHREKDPSPSDRNTPWAVSRTEKAWAARNCAGKSKTRLA